jgi:phosphoribosylanthranilate isomerase
LEDAVASVDAGADALGFIFAPSPRRISPKDAAKIIRELPANVEKIGVFVNQKVTIVQQTVQEAGLTGVQLHGDEGSAEIVQIRRSTGRGFRVIKAIRVVAGFENRFDHFSGAAPDLFLLDSGSAAARGGTGKAFNWQDAAPFIRLAARRHNVVIAGGLMATNVADAIVRFQPYGVDVVSGVESQPGKKDHDKIKEFVRAARDARAPATAVVK